MLVQIKGNPVVDREQNDYLTTRAAKVFKVPFGEVTAAQRHEIRAKILSSHYTFGDRISPFTLEDFYGVLAQSPRTWMLHSDGAIRQVGPEGLRICPRIWVGDNVPYLRLEFDYETIYRAADNRPGHDPDVRARLLSACGIPVDKVA